MEARQRWLVLGGLLTATLAAAAWVHDNENTSVDVVAAAGEGSGARARADDARRTLAQRNERPGIASEGSGSQIQSGLQIDLERLDARSLGESTRDPFAVPVRKLPRAHPKPLPPVIVAKSAPPPPPSAPSLPFKYMGKLMDGGETLVFLIHGDRNLVVRAGDTIDSAYRLDRITENELILTYLPMGQRQTLNIRASASGVSR